MHSKNVNSPNKYLEERFDLFCQYCNKQCKNLNSLKQHELRCRSNPDSKVYVCWRDSEWRKKNPGSGFKGHVAWNRGLTKDTNETVKKISDQLRGRKYDDPRRGLASTPEKEKFRREKISLSMKQNPNAGGLRLGSGRGHKGWYKGFFCDSTYELAYIIYNLDHNIEFSRCPKSIYYIYSYNNEQHRYYPDFILPDGSLVEVKGYHTSQVDAKVNSVTDRQITVLYDKDLQYAFDYIKENYQFQKIEDLYDK